MEWCEGLGRLSRRLPDVRGKVDLAWRLMERQHAAGRLGGAWEVTLADGGRFVLPVSSKMTWAAAFAGHYDRQFQQLLTQFVQPETTVLDIGAALGLWTVPLGRAASRCGSVVHAFEPFPGNIAWVRRNIDINGLADVVVLHETALGDEPGMARMEIHEQGRGEVGNAAVLLKPGDGVDVPVGILDQVALTAPISAVKIDVEGFEVRVLRGAWETIARDRPVIFGEFNTYWLADRGDDLGRLLDDLRDLDYEVFAVDGVRIRPWSARRRLELRPLGRGETTLEDLLLSPAERVPCRMRGGPTTGLGDTAPVPTAAWD